MCDIYHITRSTLHQIREEHRIDRRYAQEASTSHAPSSRPPVSSTSSRMQPIRGRGRGRGRRGVERRGRARDSGVGHGVDSDIGTCTLDPSLTTLLPSHSYPSPSIPHSVPPHIDTSPSIPPHIDTSPSIPPHIDTSPSIPPYDDTILDPLPEWDRLPGRRPRTRRVHRPLHPPLTSAPSAPSVPSAPSARSPTPQNPIAQQAVYCRRRPKRTIKAPSCGTH